MPVTRPSGSARRSGDPRKRAVATQIPYAGRSRRQLLLVIAAVIVLGVVGLLALRSGADAPDAEALGHAEIACDYTSKAEEATQVSSDARIAAAVLLLDQAIIASERAAATDPAFTDLDGAVQEVHAAGHRGDPAEYDAALAAALASCDEAIG